MPATFSDNLFPTDDAIPEKYRLSAPLNQTRYLCGGELLEWNGPCREVYSPIHERTPDGLEPYLIGSYPMLDATQSKQALAAARKAYDHGRGPWPTMKVEERIRHVESFARRMIEQRDTVVRLLMWEIGKTLPDAEKEFDRTIDYIRDTVDALKDLDRTSSRFHIEQGVIAQIRRAPLGVVLCMGPYNYPLNETFTTLIPALIMGNAVIFKPPEVGILLHEPLLEAFCDSFPPGVVNTVYGDGTEVVGPLMQSGHLDVLAFIGSTRVADILRRQHPKPHRLRCVLGLEAKNAAIVLPDADIELAVKECVLGALSFNGQRCTAMKMIFVHEQVREHFLDRLCETVDALQCGMPWEADTRITPMPDEDKVAYMQALIDDAKAHDAQIINASGGATVRTFMKPAVMYPVGPGMRLFEEEQFGPIVPVASFSDIDTPIRFIAESEYGQQVSLFGTDPQTIAKLIDPLVNQVCRVNLNSQCQRGPDTFPFTGRKASAEGTLSVFDALRSFSIRTMVAAKSTAENKELLKALIETEDSRFLSTDFIF